jgi:hypothetical protein
MCSIYTVVMSRNKCERVRHRYGSGTRDGDGRAAGTSREGELK